MAQYSLTSRGDVDRLILKAAALPLVRWSRDFGRGDKLGSPFEEDGPDGGEADAVFG